MPSTCTLLTMLVMTSEVRRERQKQATRDEIVAAAWDVARDKGLASLTLRDVAERVGMRAPSLYNHFPSKLAIYDAMYAQAWAAYDERIDAFQPRLPADPRAALREVARHFFDFCLADLPRYQLMNQRAIPGFEPTEGSYQPAVRVLARLHALLRDFHIEDEAAADLYTALIAGLVDQQWANDPGGTRWRRLLDRTIDMYADEMGLPGPRGDRP